MHDYSDEESSIENSSGSDESEIVVRGKGRQRSLLDEIKENPDLYTTRRSERNRREPSRYNILSEKSSHQNKYNRKTYIESSSEEDEESDSDSFYSKRRRKSKFQPKMEFRKRAHVSYKEADTSDDDCASDDSGQPKRKAQKLSGGAKGNNGLINVRDNPLLNRPQYLLRRCAIDQTELADDYTDTNEIPYSNDDANVIEDVLSFRIGITGNTGVDTNYYSVRLKNHNMIVDEYSSERQYLIKWRGWSHIHSTWESEASLSSYSGLDGMKKFYKFKEVQKLRENWKKSHASPEDLDAAQFEEERNETLLQQKMECERIIDVQRNRNSNSLDYLIKWKTLDYRYSTWESGDEIVKFLYPECIQEFDERSRSGKIPNRKSEVWSKRPKFVPMREQPSFLSHNIDLVLRDYQLDGMNWLARAWTRGNSVILADEMGLGKTIQTISFLAYLFNEHQMYGPFLLVVPLSTIGSWQTEFSLWAPYMNVIVYTGDAVSRQIIRECEWYFPKKKMLKFHVCITTYELLMKDKAWLNQISWAFLGVDEAHRLKNDESQLYQSLFTFDTNTRLLITGTPVHNSLRELWALLHFIMPDRFNKWEEFEDRYNLSEESGSVAEIIHELYKVLEPFLLRRTKKDVEKSLPSKSEQIIRVPMCRKQAELYKLILAKNYEALSRETRGHTSSFLNVVMELKKCCNHVQLVNPLDEETEQKMHPEDRLRYLIKSSGKMMLLDKLLFELKDKNHRVLIFSQMVRMLDIISDYLLIRGWGFQRLDGSINGSLRKQAIDHFNAEGSTDFCFLLSTRAGGLGINLATADTVIIFDSDWNPQNDLQAMARAHRIGQTKQVSVYRFIIKNSVDEKIIECAKRKMVLDHLVIQRMDSALHKKTDANKNQPFNKDELNEILKFGAAELFNQDESMDEEQELNIHDILQRAETRDNDDELTNNAANELLSAFKVVNIPETVEDEDIVYIGHKGKPKLWSEIVPTEFRDKIKEEEHQKALLELELGPRQRKKVKTYQVGQPDSSSDESSETSNKVVGKMSEKEIRAIIRVMKKFPRPLERVQSIMIEAEILERSERDIFDIMKHIIEGCQQAVNGCDSEEKKAKVTFNVGRICVTAKSFLQGIDDLDILHQSMPLNKEERLKYSLPFESKLANWSCMWETEDDARLLVGVYERGMDNWEAIKMDPDLKLTNKILPSSSTDRPQASHLRTRAEYLLKKLRDCGNAQLKSEILVPKRPVRSTKSSDVKKTKFKGKSNGPTPKSAEFVDDSDSSKSSNTSKSRLKSKVKVKPKIPVDKSKREDKINDAANQVSDREESLFYDMQGPLFDKCTRKMKPIKSELKFLEDMQRRCGKKLNPDDKELSDCLLAVGNHIRSVIITFGNDDEKRKWRNYLWSFVGFFFDVLPKEKLHRIYKTAFKTTHESRKQKSSHRKETEQHSQISQSIKKGDISINKDIKKPQDRTKCNFEAKSYHEYKIKMKNLNGETSEDYKFSDRNEKSKQSVSVNCLDKPDKRNERYKQQYHDKYQNHRSEFDDRSRKSNSYYTNSNDSQDYSKNFSKPNFNRDPRLSKTTMN